MTPNATRGDLEHCRGLARPVLYVKALATVEPSKNSPGPKEHDNDEECKAGSENRGYGRPNDRHIRGSERSERTLGRRRPPASVRTERKELPVFTSDPTQLVQRDAE